MNIEQEIKEIIAKQFGVAIDSLSGETNFNKDLGADSLDTVEIVLAIEDKFSIEILDSNAEKILTIGDVVKYVKEVKI
jgi:acyl carrier protein